MSPNEELLFLISALVYVFRRESLACTYTIVSPYVFETNGKFSLNLSIYSAHISTSKHQKQSKLKSLVLEYFFWQTPLHLHSVYPVLGRQS